MSAGQIDRNVLNDPSWWHWMATIPFLAVYLAGATWAIGVAAALCVVATAYFFSRIRAVKPYPVQIRIAYLIWMMIGLLPSMGWMIWIQLAGTSAMVTVGYCPLARMLSLLPINRSEALTLSLVGRTFFRDPCAGGLFGWSFKDAATASCSAGTTNFGTSCSLLGRS